MESYMTERPLILMICTQREDASGDEYRWTMLGLTSSPRNDRQYCKVDGKMNVAFVLQNFGTSSKHQNLFHALNNVKTTIRERFYVQIEYFPEEKFPLAGAAA
jgi:hypothetical protein